MNENEDIDVEVVISMTKGIYKITNDRTGEVYVGQAKNLESRWNRHIRELTKGQHHNLGMQKDHDSGDTFSFEILEELPNATKADLYNKESQYVKKYNRFREGYNQTPGGPMDQFKGRYESGGGRLPFEKYKPTEAYVSKEIGSDFQIKFCPNCGVEVKKPTIRCIKCGEPFFDFNKEIDNAFVQTEDISNVKIKHVDEAGVSFDFPEYYLLASIPDNTPDCIIALAKDDGTCDVMVEVSSSKDRIKYSSNFESTYKKYISDLGYYDIKTISGFDPKKVCFQSYIDHKLGTIKQITYFDFRFKKDIRITFNTLKNVDYDCMEDLKIIEKSIAYEDKFTGFKNKLIDTKDNANGEYRVSTTKVISLLVFIISGLICVVSSWEAIAYNNVSARIIGVMIAFVIGGLIFSLPVLIIGTMIKKSRKTTGKEELTLMEYLLYYNDDGQRRLSKTKIITWIVFLIVVIGNLINPINDIPLISLVIVAIILGLMLAIPTYAVGLIISKIIRRIK